MTTACKPTAPGPALAGRLAESTVSSWATSVRCTSDFWAGAVERRATPLHVAADLWRWWRLLSRRRRPRWSTPHDVLFETPLARLRDFSRGPRAQVVPTLVLPPQAGHDSCIVDFSPEQSQIATIRGAGLERLCSLDWIGATPETKTASIADYLAVVGRAVEELGAPVNLIGDCQGGWLAAIYAALHPDQVNTLTVAGAPIDFHAGEAIIADHVGIATELAGTAPYRAFVSLGGGVLRGEHMLGGFVAIKPENELEKQLELLVRLRDAEHVERYRAFEDWYRHTQHIPGAFYLWIVEELFRRNRLIRGELEIGGQRVDLARISAPLQLLAGAQDHITPPAQVFALAEAVSTPSAAIGRRTANGGHLGLFMGREALRRHWPPLLAEIRARSRRRRASRA